MYPGMCRVYNALLNTTLDTYVREKELPTRRAS